MNGARKPVSYVEVGLDDGRTVRASVSRLGRFIHLSRVRNNRWHDSIGDLTRSEAAHLQHGLADLIAAMTPEAEG